MRGTRRGHRFFQLFLLAVCCTNRLYGVVNWRVERAMAMPLISRLCRCCWAEQVAAVGNSGRRRGGDSAFTAVAVHDPPSFGTCVLHLPWRCVCAVGQRIQTGAFRLPASSCRRGCSFPAHRVAVVGAAGLYAAFNAYLSALPQVECMIDSPFVGAGPVKPQKPFPSWADAQVPFYHFCASLLYGRYRRRISACWCAVHRYQRQACAISYHNVNCCVLVHGAVEEQLYSGV